MITDTLIFESPLVTPIINNPVLVSTTLNTWYALGFTALFFVMLFLLFRWMTGKNQGYPLEEEIENALQPYLHSLIVGAFEETFENLETIEEQIQALDKTALASRIYGLLPEQVGQYDTSFLKSVLTEEQFLELFNNAYESAKSYYVEYKGKFAALFNEWNN